MVITAKFIQMKGRRRQKASSHTNSFLLIQNCMLQRLYSINIYSLQKHGFWEPFQIMEKTEKKKKKKKKKEKN